MPKYAMRRHVAMYTTRRPAFVPMLSASNPSRSMVCCPEVSGHSPSLVLLQARPARTQASTLIRCVAARGVCTRSHPPQGSGTATHASCSGVQVSTRPSSSFRATLV